jgi:replicative DNA helicase
MVFAEDEFVIPNTLAYEERLIVTGFEGHGKSTLLRQIAVQVAWGIHPWTLQPMPPKRVLVIDAENAAKQMQRDWQALYKLAKQHSQTEPKPGEFIILGEHEPDLTGTEGHEWLMERVVAHRPDLLVIGPIQNLTGRDVKDDDVVRKFKRTINECREICRSAIIMEHHCPHKAPGDSERNVRPYGSSLFMKWPDYGYGMKPTDDEEAYKWQPWRRPRVRSRQWPDMLRQGKPGTMEWPWMAEEDVSGSATVRGLKR